MKTCFVGAMFYGAFIVSMALNAVAIATLVRAAFTANNSPVLSLFRLFQLILLAALAALFVRVIRNPAD